MVSNAPHQGENLHNWLLTNTRQLLVDGISVEESKELLLLATKESGRTTQDIETEIENALLGAKEFLDANPGWVGFGRRKKITWRDPLDWTGLDDPIARKDKRKLPNKANTKLISKIINESDVHISQLKVVKNLSLKSLFCGIDFNIGYCKDIRNPIVKPLSKWLVSSWEMQFICPNYFRDYGNGGGYKNDFNIGERLYLVIEFDKGSANSQLALIQFLSHRLPLVMIVFSGHHSLHAWFACFGLTEYKVKSFCILAKELGADQTTFTPSQWVRMPNGWNYSKQKRQWVLYFDVNSVQIDLVRSEML
jgi:hypothetical protein